MALLVLFNGFLWNANLIVTESEGHDLVSLSDFLVFIGRPVRIRWPEMASKFAEIGDRSISEILRGGSVSSSHIGASPSCPKIARFPKVVRFPAQAKINWPLHLLHLPDSSKDSPFLLASLGHREIESAYWKGNLGTKSDKSAWNASDRALILSDRFVWDMIRRSPSLYADCNSGPHWKLRDAWDERRKFCAAYSSISDHFPTKTGL